jgi:hypothetical protein
MKTNISFTHDDNIYRAEYRKEGVYYLIEHIRIDFEDCLADIPIRQMRITPIELGDLVLWVDELNETNEVIRAIGAEIDKRGRK